MTAIETFAQRAKRELDLQLDEELEGTLEWQQRFTHAPRLDEDRR